MKESFITTNPELLAEWDYDKNNILGYFPENFTSGSGKKVWWKCSLGHSWEAIIGERANRKRGCPYCTGNKVITGVNDLATKRPELAKEWHPSKNILAPAEVASSSGKKFWWLCSNKHEWEDTVAHRASGRNCPICSGKRVLVGYNDFKNQYPQIASEWNYERNTIDPSEITSGSSQKVWWKCSEGHEWQTTVAMRTSQNTGCPYCSCKKVLAGYNDLATTNPDLVIEWHPTMNSISPNSVSRGTNQKVWWLCSKGHEWQAAISGRACNNLGCPICANKQVLVGYNDFQSKHPDLAREWNMTKNNGLLPSQITSGHCKPVWWLGKCGHEWKDTLDHRINRGNGCPICSGQQVLEGYNDFASAHPDLAREWHPNKNEMLPSQVTSGSNRKVWWLGKCGHEWECTVVARTTNESGCPYCANVFVLENFNDLASQFPEIAKEWHPTNNGTLLPSQIQYGSGKAVWWKCKKGHEWKTRIVNRTRDNNGCPFCHSQSSFPEQAIIYYLQKDLSVEIKNRHKVDYFGKQVEIDIFIPSMAAGIEYDGAYWHKEKQQQDSEKTKRISELGIKLIRVIESDTNRIDKNVVYYNCYTQKNQNLSWAITQVKDMLQVASASPVCIEKDYLQITELFRLSEVENSLAFKYPEIAEEWHPSKNGDLLPTNIYGGSIDMVWWLGKCGHEWQTSPNKRTSQNANCPYCSGHRVLKGFNDLSSKYPEIAKEWHPTKNEPVKPDELVYGSMKKIWWVCPNGHEYNTSVYHRTSRRTGCPYCAGVKTLKGYNDFASKYPDIAKEWHPSKNTQQPDELPSSSQTKVWWICQNGHEWQSSVYSRTRSRKTCPICSREQDRNMIEAK